MLSENKQHPSSQAMTCSKKWQAILFEIFQRIKNESWSSMTLELGPIDWLLLCPIVFSRLPQTIQHLSRRSKAHLLNLPLIKGGPVVKDAELTCCIIFGFHRGTKAILAFHTTSGDDQFAPQFKLAALLFFPKQDLNRFRLINFLLNRTKQFFSLQWFY